MNVMGVKAISTSGKAKLTFIALFEILCVAGNVFADTDDASAKYPDVAYREHATVLYPPLRDRHFVLPNGLPDVVTGVTRVDARAPWYATTFFGNKKVRLKDFDRQTYKATLMTGEQIQFALGPPGKIFELVNGLGRSFGGIGVDGVYRLADSSYIGLEFLYESINVHGARFKCDGMIRGIARFNSSGKVLWRRTFALQDKNPPTDESWGFCQHYSYPGQRQMTDAIGMGLLPDGSFAIHIGHMLVRIDGETGLPPKPVPNLSIVDSADVVAFTNATYSRLNSDANRWGWEWMNSEPAYYRLQQHFFFPQK